LHEFHIKFTGSAWNFARRFGHISDRSSPILGDDSPRNGRILGVNRGPCGGICWSICPGYYESERAEYKVIALEISLNK